MGSLFNLIICKNKFYFMKSLIRSFKKFNYLLNFYIHELGYKKVSLMILSCFLISTIELGGLALLIPF